MHGSIGKQPGERAAPSAGGMTAVLLHLFAQEESVFYLMTGMSVGIVYYFTVWLHRKYRIWRWMLICDDRFISGILGEPCAAFAGICFSRNRRGSVAFF